jgi:hypothetical protein
MRLANSFIMAAWFDGFAPASAGVLCCPFAATGVLFVGLSVGFVVVAAAAVAAVGSAAAVVAVVAVVASVVAVAAVAAVVVAGESTNRSIRHIVATLRTTKSSSKHPTA